MALAMLRGKKPFEVRNKQWAAGWYYLHVGGKRLQCVVPNGLDILQSTWPECPPADSLSSSCIVGQVFLGRVLDADVVEHAWNVRSAGRYCLLIEQAIEFQEPVLHVRGGQGVWYIKDANVNASVLAAADAGTLVKFPDPFPSLPDVRRASVRSPRHTVSWKKCRRTRRDAGKRRVPEHSGTRRKRQQLARVEEPSGKRRRANLPAVASPPVGPAGDERQAAVALAATRLAAGRTWSVLHNLLRDHLFADIRSTAANSQLVAKPGLFAHSAADAAFVFIVGTFTRRGLALADVVPLTSRHVGGSSVWVAAYRDAVTRRQDHLTDVGLHFCPLPRRGGVFASLTFIKRPAAQSLASQEKDAQSVKLLADLWGGSLAASAPESVPAISHCIRQVIPQALQDHLKEMEDKGSPHKAQRRADKYKSGFVLDIPLPVQLDLSPWRCRTCESTGTPSHYSILLSDIQLVMPGVLRHEARRQGVVFMSKRWLLYLVHSFYERMCSRACRRALVELYQANALALCGGVRALQYFSAVPRDAVFRSLLLRGLEEFLAVKVRHVRRLVNIYSGTVIRGDGHWKMAQLIVQRPPGQRWPLRPFNVLLGWCAVDGALFDIPTPASGESNEDILKDLEHIVEDLKADRLEHGVSLAEAKPVCHATDSFQKQRLALQAFYDNRMYPELNVAVEANTPKGNAVRVVGRSQSSASTRIAGEPGHECFAFRRALSAGANDRRDFDADHSQNIAELSAAPLLQPLDTWPSPVDLDPSANELLKCFVQQPAQVFKHRLAGSAAAAALRSFVQQPRADEAKTWKVLFGSLPPRGVLARLARRMGVKLHQSTRFQGHRDLPAFKKQIRRTYAWYRPGRKLLRQRLGIKRRRGQAERVPGTKRAVTKKVKAHFRRLLQPRRLQGLWNWHLTALEILQSGIPMQTGTIPCERYWTSLKSMLPAPVRSVTPRWWKLLSQIAFLKHNFRHYNSGFLPTWCRNDSLLAERIDSLGVMVSSLAGEHSSADLIFEAFRG